MDVEAAKRWGTGARGKNVDFSAEDDVVCWWYIYIYTTYIDIYRYRYMKKESSEMVFFGFEDDMICLWQKYSSTCSQGSSEMCDFLRL